MASAGPVAALRRLGAERRTGVLEIFGPARLPTAGGPRDRAGEPRDPRDPRGPEEQANSSGPRGRIHFVEGAVAYAEATAVPGIDVRLMRSELVPASRWRALAQALGSGRDGGDAPVDLPGAALPDAELERIVRSATTDAAVALLGGTSGASWRFRPSLGRWTGWAGRAGPTAVDHLLDAAAAGLRMLAAAPVGPDDAVALRPTGGDGVVVTPPLMAVLVDLAEGQTPRQAAWQSGQAVLDAVTTLSDLADQGACAVVTRRPRPVDGATDLHRVPGPRLPSPPEAPGRPADDHMEAGSAPPRSAGATPPAPRDLAPLPRRVRQTTVRPRSGHEPVVGTTDAGTLTRLIEGLRRE